MLHDVRRLLFSEDVIRNALLYECAANRVAVPNAPLQAIKVSDSSPAADATRVVLEFVTANPDKPYRVELNEHFVIGALIVACREYGVPLPRGADKHLQMTDKGLAMTVSLKVETGQRPVDKKVP